MLVFMITSLENIGDITATSDVSEQPVRNREEENDAEAESEKTEE